MINSVLEELRVRRLADRHPGENLFQSGLEVSDTCVKVTRMEQEKKSSKLIVYLKVVLLRK